MICEKLSGCPFYNDKMPMKEGIGKLFKSMYCEKDKTICARYQIATKVGPEHVPVSLYPNMKKEAEEIIRNMRRKH